MLPGVGDFRADGDPNMHELMTLGRNTIRRGPDHWGYQGVHGDVDIGLGNRGRFLGEGAWP